MYDFDEKKDCEMLADEQGSNIHFFFFVLGSSGELDQPDVLAVAMK